MGKKKKKKGGRGPLFIVALHFYDKNFQDLLRGYLRCPLLPLSTAVCSY
jgi:hypothetical protein